MRVEGDLALGPGSTVNGVDVGALNASVLRVHGHQTVHTRLVSTHGFILDSKGICGSLYLPALP